MSVSTHRPQRWRLPLIITAVVALLVTLLIATRPQLEPQAPEEKTWVVDAVRAHHRALQPQLALYGTMTSGRESELRALVAGNVVATGEHFKEGAKVTKGDLIVEIDPFDYRTALDQQRAQLQEASARLDLLQRELKRAKQLFINKDVSQQFLDNAEISLQQQEAIVLQREVAVERAQRDLQQTRLTAPYDGILSGINAQQGKRLNTNDRVATIIDNRQLEARFSLSNQQYGRIVAQDGSVIGRPVTISWHAGTKVLRYQAQVERIAAQIDFGSGGVDVYAALDKPDPDSLLRVGAFVRVSIPDRRYEDVIVVPEQALYGENTVYVVRDSRLQAETVEIAGFSGNQVFISSDRIAEGEPIVTTQIREGGAGVKVSIANFLEDAQVAASPAGDPRDAG